MNYRTEKRHTIDFVFVLLLFCIFSISALALVYTGSQVYASTVATMEENFNQNVVMDYLLEKLRQNNVVGGIEVTQMNGVEVLCLHERIGENEYTTYIYVEDGELKELLVNDDDALSLTGGQALMQVDQLSFSVEDSLLSIRVTMDGQTKTAYFSLLGGVDDEA